ncbi:MAG: efflux RND transporter permease subunit [Planctomycetes bacterium]|nr:efflux RND transporter permease subunit [Planctomycetota bacterium]
MNGLIRASLANPHAVVVFSLTIIVLGVLAVFRIPVDILPTFTSPAVQVLTFYGGMPPNEMEKDITNRMERWTGQANGMKLQESRSIMGASVIRNMFHDDVDANGALTQVNSLALGALPQLPPGTLPPVVLPYDPTSTVPVALVALNSRLQTESILYDVGRYEVRPMIMANPGASAPVVFGGKIRAVMLYADAMQMQARNLSLMDVQKAADNFNVFVPSGDVKIGNLDYAILSNSMYENVKDMGAMPLTAEADSNETARFLRDVAKPSDSAFIQTNIVRVDGRPQVYIPVYRQQGSSTLTVVNDLKNSIDDMKSRLTKSDIDLKVVMDQSVFVRASIAALVQEGALGAVLCSLVIMLFLGQLRMTAIAIFTIPLSVLAAVVALLACGQTINVMTLAGLTLAIGPMVDSAIICLENTHRHLGFGANPRDAAFLGASEVAMPELVSTLCTFLVLSPLALMPGLGKFLFMPMALGVAFSMIAAYILSRTFVPSFSALLLKPHAHADEHAHRGMISRLFARWEALIDRVIAGYVRLLDVCLQYRRLTIFGSFALLGLVLLAMSPILRRDFFPEVDAGAFEMYVRAPSGTRIERTQEIVTQVEDLIRAEIPEHDLDLFISELGVTPDWSAAYTPNAGPMDAVIKVQLHEHRQHTAQHYVSDLRQKLLADDRFREVDFGFDAGGMVRGALNEGKSTPINIRLTGKDQKQLVEIAQRIRARVREIDGVVDARVIQRLDAPAFRLDVDRDKAATIGLTQAEIMRNVIAATNSSISFHKSNFWIDPVSKNQYYVGVQYPEQDINSVQMLRNIPITGHHQSAPITLGDLATLKRETIPADIKHVNLQATIDLSMGVEGRDLGHVSDDVTAIVNQFGQVQEPGVWIPLDPDDPVGKSTLTGAKIILSGEYTKMQDTFRNLGFGLILASLLIYFLMVGLDKSFIVPLTVMLVVPLCLIGVLPMLYITGSAINVQSLLGIIFIVGIKVANTVLMTDYAQELRRHEGLSPVEAIRKAASVRVRPITMTALAAFFAMIPTALALEHGSEANAPLARAILGGLIAGEPATLFVLPPLYALLVRDRKLKVVGDSPAATGELPGAGHGAPALA